MASPHPSSDLIPVRLALIGAGAMGANYVKAVQGLADARIVAVIDEKVERANQIGAVIGARAAVSPAYAGEFDGAVIAVPSADHFRVAEPLLTRGVPCLIEKPFAMNAAECRTLMAAAETGRVCLQIGHVERFNAAVQALLMVDPEPGAIRTMTARRMSAASARVTDIDVVLDLMVHDIDIAMALKRTPVTEVRASGTKDHAVATLTFADGSAAVLTASRVTEGRTRDLTVEMNDGRVLALDYIARSLTKDGEAVPVVGDANSLGRQMTDFARAIRMGASPQVDAESALAVMDVVWRVQRALGLR